MRRKPQRRVLIALTVLAGALPTLVGASPASAHHPGDDRYWPSSTFPKNYVHASLYCHGSSCTVTWGVLRSVTAPALYWHSYMIRGGRVEAEQTSICNDRGNGFCTKYLAVTYSPDITVCTEAWFAGGAKNVRCEGPGLSTK